MVNGVSNVQQFPSGNPSHVIGNLIESYRYAIFVILKAKAHGLAKRSCKPSRDIVISLRSYQNDR